MKYNEKYDRYVDDDLVIYRWSKSLNKLIQCKMGVDRKGYFNLKVAKPKRTRIRVHRLIYETFVGEIPEGYEIDHINTIKTDNRIENLRCVTHKDNMNNPLTLNHQKQTRRGNRRTLSDFGKKYLEHYGYLKAENRSQYCIEYLWYVRHNNKCRWEE